MSSRDFVELTGMTTPRAEGCSNTGFQNDEDFDENQNTSGNNNSLRCRVSKSREHENAKQVYWRPVFWGIGLQFLLGLLILRTDPGFMAFDWLGQQVLPIVVFLSTVKPMLYYLGLMQWIIRKVGWVMLVTMGSSPIESVVAAGNIFIRQQESPLLVRPYSPHITKSELHIVMTAGFSTIARSFLGAYTSYAVRMFQVMSAPASLAVAKLFWPETETPKITLKNAMKMETGDSRNLLEAARKRVSSSISLVANIAVNLIAFLALLSFVNAALSWFENMFDYPQLSFEIHSETIATYTLCGFANIGSLEIVIGRLTSMAPSRKCDITSGSVRALIAGTIACFMTACIAGLLSSTPVDINCHYILENAFNSSSPTITADVVSCQSLLNSTIVNGPGSSSQEETTACLL